MLDTAHRDTFDSRNLLQHDTVARVYNLDNCHRNPHRFRHRYAAGHRMLVADRYFRRNALIGNHHSAHNSVEHGMGRTTHHNRGRSRFRWSHHHHRQVRYIFAPAHKRH